MYKGISALALDAKGRMLIPTKYRDALTVQCGGQLTVTRHPHGCLLLLPRTVWADMEREIAAWPMAARSWQRIFMGNATDVDIDNAGRILIAPELRSKAGLTKDVVMLGMGSHFEIWDAAQHDANEAATLAAGMPDILNGFSF
ncbi:division/cell wall cluster transcriptional repressor MraZ [Hydromonas duriensis]|uniref:Transcriptional regulator MraZ n=1 Tax=Hydromonas duriensis TaxID=1527608 RepID=A0A4R6Y5R1_9BURK|nr:division/cell wall cluster transcriptional repressor MraZ [Hydromonas duriensis]TDR30828.1 division/cell wall cluster transcriptional repressor MraZ [Hydromonas duriensis]